MEDFTSLCSTDGNYILKLLKCDNILLFSSSNADIEDLETKLNKPTSSDSIKIGKSYHDDIINLLFLDERLIKKTILLTIVYENNNQKIIQLTKNFDLLWKKIFYDQKKNSNNDKNSLIRSINNHLLDRLISVKSYFLKIKFERRFDDFIENSNFDIENEIEKFII